MAVLAGNKQITRSAGYSGYPLAVNHGPINPVHPSVVRTPDPLAWTNQLTYKKVDNKVQPILTNKGVKQLKGTLQRSGLNVDQYFNLLDNASVQAAGLDASINPSVQEIQLDLRGPRSLENLTSNSLMDKNISSGDNQVKNPINPEKIIKFGEQYFPERVFTQGEGGKAIIDAVKSNPRLAVEEMGLGLLGSFARISGQGDNLTSLMESANDGNVVAKLFAPGAGLIRRGTLEANKPEFNRDATLMDYFDAASYLTPEGLLGAAGKGAKAAAKTAEVVSKMPKAAKVATAGLAGAGAYGLYNASNPDQANASILGSVLRDVEKVNAAKQGLPYDTAVTNGWMNVKAYDAIRALHPEGASLPAIDDLEVVGDQVKLSNDLTSGIVKWKTVEKEGKKIRVKYRGPAPIKRFVKETFVDNLPQPASKINATAKATVERVNKILDKPSPILNGKSYNQIIQMYGFKPRIHVSKDVPNISQESLDFIQQTHGADYGNAWSYDPITGEPVALNNEHVYGVAGVTQSQIVDLANIHFNTKLTKSEKASKIQQMLHTHNDQTMTVLDPNENIVLLTKRANQSVIAGAAAQDKPSLLMTGRTTEEGKVIPGEGGRFIPAPKRTNGEFTIPSLVEGASAPLTGTMDLYTTKINNMVEKVPSLGSDTVLNRLRAYDEYVKPIQTALQNQRITTARRATLEAQLKEALLKIRNA
jgi:hypothetical protein